MQTEAEQIIKQVVDGGDRLEQLSNRFWITLGQEIAEETLP